MAEDGRREPTVEDFRAMLAAARLLEATTRPSFGGRSWAASDAANMLRTVFRESGMKSFSGATTYIFAVALDAAREMVEAADDPLRRLEEERKGRRGTLQWPLGIVIDDASERARLVTAIDALAGAADLLAVVPSLSAGSRKAVEEKGRVGAPIRCEDRDAEAAAMKDRGEKLSVIKGALGYSSTRHASRQISRWRARHNRHK